jgi:hypothetical protein
MMRSIATSDVQSPGATGHVVLAIRVCNCWRSCVIASACTSALRMPNRSKHHEEVRPRVKSQISMKTTNEGYKRDIYQEEFVVYPNIS